MSGGIEAGYESIEAERYIIPRILTEKALLSTGIHIGTTSKTRYMMPYISKIRDDGLHILDINKTIERIHVAGRFIARHDPAKVVAYSSREFCKTPVEKFAEVTGCVGITGRFMPGTFTNLRYPGHVDAELLIVSDPAADQQAVSEAARIGIPVIAVVNSDNLTADIDLAIPANNRGRKACAAVFWLLARATLVHSGLLASDQPLKYSIEDFETKLEELE
jgi:small subunit ribosomal protein S2